MSAGHHGGDWGQGSEMTPQIGLLMREWRTAGGLTLGKLAQKSGIDKSALSRWESGGRQPRVPELEATLDALNASPAQRAQAFSLIDAPRSIRRLRQRPDIHGLGAPPAAGDLLRAMRLRKRQTQEAVAAQLGVRQGTVARWERGERLPANEQIQEICYFLEAHEEEFVALTQGRFLELSTEEAQGSAGEQEERLEQTMNNIIVGIGPDGSTDLIMLTLERKAWLLANRRESARWLLARILSHHAEMHRNAERWGIAGPLAAKALSVTPRQEKEPDFVVRAAIMHAAVVTFGGNRFAPRHGLHALKGWVARTDTPIFIAWLQSSTASFAALDGQTEAALTLGKEARRVADASGNSIEGYLRSMDYARLLLRVGLPEIAARELPAPAEMWGGAIPLANDLLVHVEAHLLCGNKREAREWLQRSVSLLEPHPVPSLWAKAEAFADKL